MIRFTLLALCAALPLFYSSALDSAEWDDSVNVGCKTTKGDLLLEVYPDWAPAGAARFLTLVHDGFFTDVALFRTVAGFLSQFGISGDPTLNSKYPDIEDDPDLKLGIKQHYLSYAGHGLDSRGTQVFVALADLDWLGREGEDGAPDGTWETPFGKAVQSDHVLAALYTGYGEEPDQHEILARGNDYVREKFPLLDFIESCTILATSTDSRTPAEVGLAAHSAAAAGEERRLRRLLTRFPAAIHAGDENGWQPIHEAARAGHVSTVQLLVELGAETGAKTADGSTPLYLAKRSDEEDGAGAVVAYLEGRGAAEDGPDLYEL